MVGLALRARLAVRVRSTPSQVKLCRKTAIPSVACYFAARGNGNKACDAPREAYE